MAEKATAKSVDKLPDQKVLENHLAKMDGFKATMDSARGKLGELVKTGEDERHIHRQVAKLMQKLRKMEAASLLAWLTHFDDYRTKLAIDDLCPKDMFAEDEAEQSEQRASEGDDNDKGETIEEEQPPPGMARDKWEAHMKALTDPKNLPGMRKDEPKPPPKAH